MKNDVLNWSEGITPGKIISKETLNHPGLIELVSGLDVYRETPEAYRIAYEKLGIDLINQVPLENAPEPCRKDEIIRREDGKYRQYLGVFDSVTRHSFACRNSDEVWSHDMKNLTSEGIDAVRPYSGRGEEIKMRDDFIGDIGCFYPMLYTTLFMYPVEYLGWEVFMEAAYSEADRFHEHFLLPCVAQSVKSVETMARNSSCPFVFLHDDLASAAGPVFPPSWYDDYIFPHYPEIFASAKANGKKIMFVADGNMTAFLPRLIELGVDGFMCENPATPLDGVIEYFGAAGKFFIGGIETALLSFGTPAEIKNMVYRLIDRAGACPGFAMSSCGGLHGNIPIENLIAYFDARVDIGATPANWRA